MNIGLVCQSYDNRTGIGRVVKALASEFAENGHAVYCAAQHFEEVDHRIVTRIIPSLSSSKGVNKLLLRLNGSPFTKAEVDIINTFGVGRGADVVTAQSCHRAGMDLLRSKRDQFLEPQALGLYDRVSLNDERSLLTSRSTKRVIAVSQLVKSQIVEQYSVPPDMVAVVPNGIHNTLFEELRTHQDRTSQRTKLGLSPVDFVFLFVGNEFGRKGLKVLLQSLAGNDDSKIHLLVAGGGDRRSYARFAAELGIGERVNFMGKVAAVEKLFLTADAFVLPSLYEPFGIVILEAMAAGVPVITTKSCGAVEDMSNRQCALLLEDPTSVEELAEAMSLLRRDESMRRALIASAIEKAKEYSWDKIARRMLINYDEVRRKL